MHTARRAVGKQAQTRAGDTTLNHIQCAGARVRRLANGALAALIVAVLAACGGGNGDADATGPVASAGSGTGGSTGSGSGAGAGSASGSGVGTGSSTSGGNGGSGTGGDSGGGSVTPPPKEPPAIVLPASEAEARRFLTQATFGPTASDVDHLMKVGYSAWMDEQFAKPQKLHRTYWDAENKAIKAANANSSAGQREVHDSFYQQALNGEDQLRQRVAFALSEVFVISMAADGLGGDKGQGVASYLDMLGRDAFGTYRTLIEDVARHPMMGIYLSHLANKKEDPAKGRVPDRELRARGDAAVLDRPVPAQPRRQPEAEPRRHADRNLWPEGHRRPGQGLHRLELGRPGHRRRPLLRLGRGIVRPGALLHVDAGLHAIPLAVGEEVPRREGARPDPR